jgi:Lrp/AsnC family leucine-responsive transcriptional regulator
MFIKRYMKKLILPSSIEKGLKRLREEHKEKSISVKNLKGRYYVYENIYYKENNKIKQTSRYLGIITELGAFIRRGATKKERYIEKAKAIIEQNGGKIIWPKEENSVVYTLDEIDKIILMSLSMNGRIHLKKIAERTGLSVKAIDYRKRKLEKEYNIKYFAEIDVEKLGFSYFIALVNFKDKAPLESEIKAALNDNPHVQLALLTSGSYDLIIVLLAENTKILDGVITEISSNPLLSKYSIMWYVSPFDPTYGYIQFRDKFFDLLKEKVWHRTLKTPRPLADSLFQREYVVLRELSRNGLQNFSDIDKKYNLSIGTSHYTYSKLISEDKQLIKRITIMMERKDVKYNAIIKFYVLRRIDFLNTRKELLLDMIEDNEYSINKFCYVGDLDSPDGGIMFLPVINDSDLVKEEEKLREKVKGIVIEHLIVIKPVVGELSYRYFDNVYSKQYQRLLSTFKVPPFLKVYSYKSNINTEHKIE